MEILLAARAGGIFGKFGTKKWHTYRRREMNAKIWITIGHGKSMPTILIGHSHT